MLGTNMFFKKGAARLFTQTGVRGMSSSFVTLPRNSNQARGLGEYAIEFMKMDNKRISDEVYDRVQLFHTDSVVCGVSAIALKTNAPNILRDEAINDYSVNPPSEKKGPAASKCFGSKLWVHSEKAIVANCSAVREWDSNGTVFGFDPTREGHNAGEFGHNDFYPVVIAAAQNNTSFTGRDALKGMILLDEIRGRLAEVFSLKTYKIDHVVHGAIASAATYGAMMGATPEQIEHAIGMVVAHYIPWRAIRAGK
jgi:2-methylcitrate dehydratase